MKEILVIFFLTYHSLSFSQPFPNFDKLTNKELKKHKADSIALKASNFLLSTAFGSDYVNRKDASVFIINWMLWTPNYTFDFEILKSNVTDPPASIYEGIYMAAITRFCLENKELSKDVKAVKLNSVKQLLLYCENPSNNLKIIPEKLQRLSDANKKGNLEDAL